MNQIIIMLSVIAISFLIATFSTVYVLFILDVFIDANEQDKKDKIKLKLEEG